MASLARLSVDFTCTTAGFTKGVADMQKTAKTFSVNVGGMGTATANAAASVARSAMNMSRSLAQVSWRGLTAGASRARAALSGLGGIRFDGLTSLTGKLLKWGAIGAAVGGSVAMFRGLSNVFEGVAKGEGKSFGLDETGIARISVANAAFTKLGEAGKVAFGAIADAIAPVAVSVANFATSAAETFTTFFEGMRPSIDKVMTGVQRFVASAEFVVKNWGEAFTLVGTFGAFALEKIANDATFIFTQQLPAALKAFGELSKDVFMRQAENIGAVASAIQKSLSSGTFVMPNIKGYGDLFAEAFGKIPSLAERPIGQLEGILSESLGKGLSSFEKRMGEFADAKLAGFGADVTAALESAPPPTITPNIEMPELADRSLNIATPTAPAAALKGSVAALSAITGSQQQSVQTAINKLLEQAKKDADEQKRIRQLIQKLVEGTSFELVLP